MAHSLLGARRATPAVRLLAGILLAPMLLVAFLASRADAADTTPPTAPRHFNAVRGDAQATLRWSASTDDVGVRRYRVYVDGRYVARLAAGARSYTAHSLKNGRTYTFALRAFDAAWNGSPTVKAKARPKAGSTAPSAPSAPTPTTPTPTTPAAPAGSVGGSLPTRLPQSSGATFYVAPSGSDSNSGTQASPWRTVQKALNTLKAGQTALVRAGTYAQNLTLSHAGTSSAPITIRNYPGEKPVLKAGSGSGDNYALQVTSGAAYVRLDGVVLDGATGSSTADVYASGNAHDIEFLNTEIRNSQRQGVFTEDTTARIQFIDCYVHDNGGSGPHQQDHNIYLEGSHHAVIGSVVARSKNGYGIQVYPSNDHAVIAGNTITGASMDGIVVGSDGSTTASNVLIVNNILTGNSSGISTYWGGRAGSGNVARNNLAWGNRQSSFTGSGISYSKNLTTDPKFVDAAGGNFRLQSGSPALSVADGGYVPLKDLAGTARPQGAGPDLGAFER